MATISGTTFLLKQAARAADLNGNGTLATNEIAQALKQGLITKAQRDMLTRTAADAGNSRDGLKVTNYDRWLDRYALAVTAADQDGLGTVSAAEIKQSNDNFKKPGEVWAIWATRSMVKKFAKVQAESTVWPE